MAEMTAKQIEYNLIEEWQSHRTPAIDMKIYKHFKNLVLGFVKYLHYHPHYEDLKQEAFTAFTYALKNFDISKNLRFSTYLATAVHNRVGRYLKRSVYLFPCGSEYQKENKLYFKILELFSEGSGKALDEFIEQEELDRERVFAVYQCYQIYDRYEDDELNTLTELHSAQEDGIIDKIAFEEVRKATKLLPPAHRKALIERMAGVEPQDTKHFKRGAASQLGREGIRRIKYFLKKAEEQKTVLWEAVK